LYQSKPNTDHWYLARQHLLCTRNHSHPQYQMCLKIPVYYRHFVFC